MKSRCLLLIVALVAVCVGEEPPSCDPDCAGHNLGDFVPDPTDCKQYYICLGDGKPSDTPLTCPDGTSFDVGTSKCTGPEDCESDCAPTGCHITCDGIPDVIADPKDCGVLYVCTGDSVLGPISCPPDKPFFNGTSCGTDFTACCKDLCNPYCFDGADNVPDPLDCTKYYRCAAVGPVEEALHLPCPDGQNFDIPSGECASGAACTVLCDEAQITTKPVVVTPTSGCLTSLTCTEVGFFAQCTTCEPDYFHCTAIGQPAVNEKCTGDLVFNPDPDYPFCVLPSNCPYHPLTRISLLTP